MKPNSKSREMLSSLTGVPVDSIPADASIATFPDWDSIIHMELIIQIEARLSRPLNDDEMFSVASLDGIDELLSENENEINS